MDEHISKLSQDRWLRLHINSDYSIEFRKDNGDGTLRINYDLTEDSVIMDLGGYRGDWTNLMINKYNCTSHIFEPVKSLVNRE